ncbi:hypothetical protein PHMEG_00040292, partial [Phytophthora megakarya]
ALLRRYGMRLDRSQAEWRVNNCQMLPGESYGDYAARLRQVVGRNRVSERVLLAQFYRYLEKATRQLVKQAPRPRYLEKAVEKANKIDGPMDNVARGMANVGLPFATAPTTYVMPMLGTSGQTMMIPGIGSAGLVTEVNQIEETTEDEGIRRCSTESLALFNNPQGVYNAYAGIWEPPSGHVWNGKYWEPKVKVARKRMTKPAKAAVKPQQEAKRPVSAAKVKREEATADDEPMRKKIKAAVKQVQAEERRQVERQQSSQATAAGRASTNAQCFGHYARDCSSAEAKAYKAKVAKAQKETRDTDDDKGNESRVP